MRFFPAVNDLKALFDKKGKKGYPRNYRHVHLTSVPGKTMEKIILGSIEKHLEEKTVIIHSQHGFRRVKYCLLDLISSYSRVTYLVHVAKPFDATLLDFSKGFDSVFQRILLDQISSPQQNKHILGWVRNWLTSWAQKVIIVKGVYIRLMTCP